MKSITLVVVGGDLEAKEVQLNLPATIGRGREASLSLPHPLVSRKHCEIVDLQGRVLVRDLDSLNGTFVGSERVADAILRPGDLLTVGTVTFRAVYQESEPAPDPPPEVVDADSDDAVEDPLRGTAAVKFSSSDTMRVDPASETPPAPSEPSDSPHPAEYDS